MRVYRCTGPDWGVGDTQRTRSIGVTRRLLSAQTSARIVAVVRCTLLWTSVVVDVQVYVVFVPFMTYTYYSSTDLGRFADFSSPYFTCVSQRCY